MPSFFSSPSDTGLRKAPSMELSLRVGHNSRISCLLNRPILFSPALRTFSGTQENQKHHLVFVTDKPVRSLEKRNRLQKALTELFAGDVACNDVNRIFFGGNLFCFSQSAWYLIDADIKKLIGGDAA